MLPTVSFFVVFALAVQMTKFDPIKSSKYQILFVNMLQIYRILGSSNIVGLSNVYALKRSFLLLT